MAAGLVILTGSRAGFHFSPAGTAFIAGRGPDAALRFSPDTDLAVSARHAGFALHEGVWWVRDLDSRNGTFVNGVRITGATPLRPGDRVMFGAGGPAAELVEEAAAPAATASGTTATVAAPEGATQRVRAAVHRERRMWGVAAMAVVVVVGAGAFALAAAERRERAVWQADRATLEARIDSIIDAGRSVEASLSTEVSGLLATLRESEQRLQQLRTEMTAAADGGHDVAELQRQLLTASTALRRQQLAASLDFDLIQRRNRPAVAMVWVEYEDGGRVTGTAFAVRADGMLLTNRHLVDGGDGSQRHRRIAVRFADSDQAFPARVIAIDQRIDLAALRVDNIAGDVPVVARFNLRPDTLPAGAPLAVIGFPLGGETAQTRVARPLISAGLLIRSAAGALELQGLGAAGASGSPIMDANGDVVGVLYGGSGEAGVLLAVPAAAAAAFLRGR